jgi:hypothetical protein
MLRGQGKNNDGMEEGKDKKSSGQREKKSPADLHPRQEDLLYF